MPSTFRCGFIINDLIQLRDVEQKFAPNRNILPNPQFIDYSEINYELPRIIPIEVFNIDIPERFSYHLNENLRYKYPFELDIEYTTIDPIPEPLILESYIDKFTNLPDNIRKQAYFLTIRDQSIHIWAETEQGAYYGLVTLSQLFYYMKNTWIVPGLTILDYPTYELRGTTIQLCHGQVPTVNSLYRLIHFLARYKNNLLGLNLEDIMSFDQWPQIGKTRGALTTEEIRNLHDEARKYYVELFPGFQALGHLENFLFHPEFRDLAEFPGANALNLSNPRSYDVLEQWYREIIDKFNPKIIHIEMDEAYDFGLYASKSFLKSKGRGKILLDHILWVHDLLHNQFNKDIYMYHDTLMTEKSILDMIPKDIKIIFWHYTTNPNFHTVRNLVKKGFFVFISPSIANWSRPIPDITYSYKNISIMARKGYRYGARGFMNSMWGDYSNENLHELIYYSLAIGSDFAWNPYKHKRFLFQQSFGEDLLGMANPNLLWDTLFQINRINRGYVFNTPFFHRLWEHPFGVHEPNYPKKIIHKDLKQLELARGYLNAMHQSVTRNRDLLEYLSYVIEIAEFNAKKAELSHKLYRWGKKDRLIRPVFLPKLKQILQNLDHLWVTYRHLWLRCAKPEGLERIERNYLVLRNIYSDLIEFCTHTLPYRVPFLESSWICHPTAKNNQKPHLFRKIIRLPEDRYSLIKYARVQCIANTYLRFRINTQEVGEVISRFYLSPVIFDNAVKIFDILPFLQKGANIIEVEGWEFTGSTLSVNIYGEIAFKDGTLLKIPSNLTWAVRSVDDHKSPLWMPVKELGKPPMVNGEIFPPNLTENRPSWISRKFGEQGYRESLILMKTKSQFLARLGAILKL